MKKLIGLLLSCSFVFLVSSAQANSEVSYDKVSHVKQAVKSDVVLNAVTFEFNALFIADGQYIDDSINNANEYVLPVGETKPGHYNYAVVKHRDPGAKTYTS